MIVWFWCICDDFQWFLGCVAFFFFFLGSPDPGPDPWNMSRIRNSLGVVRCCHRSQNVKPHPALLIGPGKHVIYFKSGYLVMKKKQEKIDLINLKDYVEES